MLEKELQFFVDHQDEFVAKYRGKVLAIQGEQVCGVYDSTLRAFLETRKSLTPGTFLLQSCEPGVDAYTVTLSSLELVADPR